MKRRVRRRRARGLARLGCAIAILLAGAGPAMAQDATAVTIRGVTQAEDGATSVVVTVTGPAAGQPFGTQSFQVVENGVSLQPTSVKRYSGSDARPIAVAVVLDASGSMAGQALVDAKQAATAFVNGLPSQTLAGLVTFNTTARLVVGFSTDRGKLRSAIGAVTVGGDTALYDAVALAAGELQKLKAQANMVVLSDGKDTTSVAGLDAARSTAAKAKAAVTAVGLTAPDFDEQALRALVGDTGGSYVPVQQSDQLVGAFGRAARELNSQFLVSYRGTDRSTSELSIDVALVAGGATASDSVVVLSERKPDSAPQRAHSSDAFASETVMLAGLGLLGLAVAIFLYVLLASARRKGDVVLDRAVTYYSARRAAQADDKAPSGRSLRDSMLALAERFPKPRGYEARTDRKLERAALPLRAPEFLMIRAGSALGASFFGLLAARQVWFALLCAVGGWFVPRLVVERRISKRNADFAEQLPDTLMLLAASLEAGYGVLQGLETIVREAPSPTAEEFGRTLAEIRLGVPMHEALDSMTDRIGGEDFRWVIVAMNIQREVGGNLVEILGTVADTIRERGRLRRTVKALSAEGRLSAVILTVMPFVLSAYLALVNPKYIGTLFSATAGIVFVGIALFLMCVGVVWMRKIVRIEV